jgi:pimeloyl-ACP methyl ester carboxylesterase
MRSDASNDGSGATDARHVLPSVSHCDGKTSLLELPDDPGERGPWAVGSRAIKVAGLYAEVWYPAALDSERGLGKFTYDLRKYLPANQQSSVTNASTLEQACDCYRDLPLDEAHGPYAVVLFAHGFSGFSGQSLEQMVHWASRGFVVVSADHPSLGLKTFLTDGIVGIAGGFSAGGCDLSMASGQGAEVISVLDALKTPTADLAFLASHIDLTRMAATGHSAGGMAIAALSSYPNVQVLIPMASGGVCAGPSLKSTLVMGAMQDSILAYSGQQQGYMEAPAPKRLVGLNKAGHMAFTSFCPIGAGSGGILMAAQNAGVMFDPVFLSVVGPLAADGCSASNLPAELGWRAINFATAGVLEETLLCMPERAGQLAQAAKLFPDAIGEFQESL